MMSSEMGVIWWETERNAVLFGPYIAVPVTPSTFPPRRRPHRRYFTWVRMVSLQTR